MKLLKIITNICLSSIIINNFLWGLEKNKKSEKFFISLYGNYIKNHSWGNGEMNHYTGAGVGIGYYFLIPNKYELINKITVGVSFFNKYSRLSAVDNEYPTKISDYFVNLDWVYEINRCIHPFFGVSYHYINFDIRGKQEIGWYGPGIRLGTLFYIGEHFEIELGGEYIYLGSKTDSDYPAETPTWKGSVALNYSF